MNFIQKAKAVFANLNPYQSRESLSLGLSFGSSVTNTGVSITEQTAMGNTAVFAAVRLISNLGGMLPIHMYEEQANGSVKRKKDHRLEWILQHQPNRFMHARQFWTSQLMALTLWGNSYAIKEFNDRGQLVALYPISPTRVTLMEYPDRTEYTINGLSMPNVFQSKDIFHIRGMSTEGIVGLSPVQSCKEALGVANAAEQFGARYFAGDGTPRTLLMGKDAKMSDQQLMDGLGFMRKQMTGLSDVHKLLIMKGEFDVKPLQEAIGDSQFIESRRFSVKEVARIFGIPPHMLMDMDGSTFSNIAQQDLQFLKYALAPYLNNIQASIECSLLDDSEKMTISARFDVEDLLKLDRDSLSKWYKEALNNCWMTPNEVRGKENLLPLPDGDKLLCPVNYSTLEKVVNSPVNPSITPKKSQN